MFHRNDPLTPEGRRRLCERVNAGRAICHVAAEAEIARQQTLGRWYARRPEEGPDGLQEHSSRPDASPNQTDPATEARGRVASRAQGGTVQLVGKLAEENITMPASTIYGSWSVTALPAA